MREAVTTVHRLHVACVRILTIEAMRRSLVDDAGSPVATVRAMPITVRRHVHAISSSALESCPGYLRATPLKKSIRSVDLSS